MLRLLLSRLMSNNVNETSTPCFSLIFAAIVKVSLRTALTLRNFSIPGLHSWVKWIVPDISVGPSTSTTDFESVLHVPSFPFGRLSFNIASLASDWPNTREKILWLSWWFYRHIELGKRLTEFTKSQLFPLVRTDISWKLLKIEKHI